MLAVKQDHHVTTELELARHCCTTTLRHHCTSAGPVLSEGLGLVLYIVTRRADVCRVSRGRSLAHTSIGETVQTLVLTKKRQPFRSVRIMKCLTRTKGGGSLV
jgi:hypothetical protein